MNNKLNFLYLRIEFRNHIQRTIMKTRYILYILLIFSILFTSCSKTKLEDKLIGDWEKISVGQISEGTTITWTFNADHQLFRTTTRSGIVNIDTAEWSVDNRIAQKNTLSIDNLDQYCDGKHEIHQLNDYLRLQRIEFANGHTDGSFQWNEFEKK